MDTSKRFDLSGKVALVTGASSGLGVHFARTLAAAGASVAIAARRADRLASLQAELQKAGSKAAAVGLDVTSGESVSAAFDAAETALGAIDIVVNNAGISPAPVPTAEYDLAQFHKVLDVNLWGVIHGCRVFLPQLLERPEANIVNVCSFAGLVGMIGFAPYNTSKFGVRGLTESLQIELANTNVSVTLLCPGGTKTSIMTNSPVIPEADKAKAQANLTNSKQAIGPEKVADGVLKGITGNKPRVLVGTDTFALDKLSRLLPGAYPKLLHKKMAAMMKEALG